MDDGYQNLLKKTLNILVIDGKIDLEMATHFRPDLCENLSP